MTFVAGMLGAASLRAQTPPPATEVTLDPVAVTATRGAERLFDVPASADVIEGATIRNGQPAINLSESLVRVPGVFAANRNNYAQDLQLSSRGYGARAAFGVRGVRLYQDDIPATMPDGQGQTGSFSLLSAGRIEVLRGPFSTLYGNASGGVVSVYTEDGTRGPRRELHGECRQLRHVECRGQGHGHRGRRRLCGRVQQLRHGRLSRPFRGVAPGRQRQVDIRRHRYDACQAHRQLAIPAAHAGPARPHLCTVAGQSPAGGSCGNAVQHEQDHQPGARRRGGGSGAEFRYRTCASPATADTGRSASIWRCREVVRRRPEAWSTSIAISRASEFD